MIKLTKGDKPEILIERADEWTKALVDKKARGEEPTEGEKGRYRHPQIKEALIRETHGKCAYCESKLQHIAYGDIEHISPKSSDVRLTFDWGNLTLACDVCNTNKGIVDGIVDPYNSDPSLHFTISGPLILANPTDDVARLTELKLDLNRAALVERRREKIVFLRDQVEIYLRAANPNLKAVLKIDLERTIADSEEFSAIARHYVAMWCD
ncbi:HNH endonuclease [Burkholderia vietnamiensis]|uniref:HNH endonuclease n=1 Tax=Burkholderia vietnamiensis TaxID=60552 RepID=UPI0009BE5F90|nr:HNH endonuclease [Burkholderia vietnamiensis]MBR8188699.1 HNH endonuclease [Burkholderia vietnamiensis]